MTKKSEHSKEQELKSLLDELEDTIRRDSSAPISAIKQKIIKLFITCHDAQEVEELSMALEASRKEFYGILEENKELKEQILSYIRQNGEGM